MECVLLNGIPCELCCDMSCIMFVEWNELRYDVPCERECIVSDMQYDWECMMACEMCCGIKCVVICGMH